MNNSEFDNIAFDLPKHQSNVIKVIGVGGGGSNAVNQMFKKGISGVDFVVCNTDAQALQNSPVPNKIQLGVSLTEGLGAGANPEIGEQSALESLEELKTMLDSRAKMVFITVGMGGGTGTGAAPIIAKLAKELDLLTVAIVTMPFGFEGKTRNLQAQNGVEKLRKYVDSIVIINNNKLREVYGNLGFKAGFSKADEVLSTAARGIAEVITHHYTQNIDLRDAKTVLSNSGTAIMGSASAFGPNRAQVAISKALDSPLLNDNKIIGAKNVLLLIVSGSAEITIDEIGEINDYIQTEAKSNVDIIMGVGEDDTLAESISVTIIATGFNKELQHEITNSEAIKIVHTLEDEQEMIFDLTPKLEVKSVEPDIIRYTLFDDEVALEEKTQIEEVASIIETPQDLNEIEVDYQEVIVENIEEFVITSVAKKEDPIIDEVQEEMALTFDFPLPEKKQVFQYLDEEDEPMLVKDVNEIEVEDYNEIKPELHTNETPLIFSLEDYLDIEDTLDKPAPKIEKPVSKLDSELDMQLEIRPETIKNKSLEDENSEVSSFDIKISELTKRTEDRRKKFAIFNFQFQNRTNQLKMNQNIDEIEKQPAYKRMGINLSENEPSSIASASRMSLDTDENDEPKLRSNNSFLHDNVD